LLETRAQSAINEIAKTLERAVRLNTGLFSLADLEINILKMGLI